MLQDAQIIKINANHREQDIVGVMGETKVLTVRSASSFQKLGIQGMREKHKAYTRWTGEKFRPGV